MKPIYLKRRRSWLLVPSYLTGPETLRGVAEVLTVLGQDVVIPPPVRTCPGDTDHLGPWCDAVVAAASTASCDELVVVGHSAACPRLPMVADALLAEGRNVTHMILVNGRFPATDGQSPVEADETLADMLDGMVRPDDYLPPWYGWWGGMVVDMVPPEDRERVFADFKPVPRSLFDQPIPVPKLPPTVVCAFLATGDMYAMAYEQAVAEGWQVARLDGEHLHVVADPVTVAGTLLSLVGRPRVDHLADKG